MAALEPPSAVVLAPKQSPLAAMLPRPTASQSAFSNNEVLLATTGRMVSLTASIQAYAAAATGFPCNVLPTLTPSILTLTSTGDLGWKYPRDSIANSGQYGRPLACQN